MKKEILLNTDNMPKHIAIVMDGNGRWAQKRNLPRLAGHNAGMQALKEIVKTCSVLGVKHLTVYAFSTENWKRPKEEIMGIFKILIIYMERELEELHQNNVKVNILGDYKKLPKDAVDSLNYSLITTQDNTGLQFNIALNYGGRDEILRAVKLLSNDIACGQVSSDSLDDELMNQYLYTKDMPDPDLIIRTSGEQRLSNYLLWQSAYSELVFTDVLWPEFTPEELKKAILVYQKRKRRYGGI